MQDEFLLFFAGRINMENGFSVFLFDLVLFAINEYFDFCFAMAFFIYYKDKHSFQCGKLRERIWCEYVDC